MVATTHSPQLLGLLSKQSREYAALTYRIPGKATTELRRIMDIPEAQGVLENQDLARLHTSGWFEKRGRIRRRYGEAAMKVLVISEDFPKD